MSNMLNIDQIARLISEDLDDISGFDQFNTENNISNSPNAFNDQKTNLQKQFDDKQEHEEELRRKFTKPAINNIKNVTDNTMSTVKNAQSVMSNQIDDFDDTDNELSGIQGSIDALEKFI